MADMAKKASKQVMDFEGRKYEKAFKRSSEHQINASKLNAVWHRLKKQMKVTSSYSKSKQLKEKVQRLQKQEREQMSQVVVQNEKAKLATINQHQVALQLDKQLAAFVADAIAAKEESITPKEAEAKQAEEIATEESTQEMEEVKLRKTEVGKLDKKLAGLQ